MSEFDPDLIEVTVHLYAGDYDRPITVDVYAVGGGTPGESLAYNYWGYRVTDKITGQIVISGEDLYVGGMTDHIDAASWAADFIEFDGHAWHYLGEDEELTRVVENSNDKEQA